MKLGCVKHTPDWAAMWLCVMGGIIVSLFLYLRVGITRPWSFYEIRSESLEDTQCFQATVGVQWWLHTMTTHRPGWLAFGVLMLLCVLCERVAGGNCRPLNPCGDLENSQCRHWNVLHSWVHFSMGLTCTWSCRGRRDFPRLRFQIVCKAINNEKIKPV